MPKLSTVQNYVLYDIIIKLIKYYYKYNNYYTEANFIYIFNII